MASLVKSARPGRNLTTFAPPEVVTLTLALLEFDAECIFCTRRLGFSINIARALLISPNLPYMFNRAERKLWCSANGSFIVDASVTRTGGRVLGVEYLGASLRPLTSACDAHERQSLLVRSSFYCVVHQNFLARVDWPQGIETKTVADGARVLVTHLDCIGNA